MIRTVFLAAFIFLVATFPPTRSLMLFLRNLHFHVGYWGMLPLGIVASMLI